MFPIFEKKIFGKFSYLFNMDIKLSEDRLFKLINRVILNHYGQDFVVDKKIEGDSEYVYFTIPGLVYNDGTDKLMFHKNFWGLLWVEDWDLYNKIKEVFGFDDDTAKEYIRKYFEKKYDIKIKGVKIVSDW